MSSDEDVVQYFKHVLILREHLLIEFNQWSMTGISKNHYDSMIYKVLLLFVDFTCVYVGGSFAGDG